jgi:putative heme-binding domain-containing protein
MPMIPVALWMAALTGEQLYVVQCAMCHGKDGEGGRGPALARPTLVNAPDDEALKGVIKKGIPGTGMPGHWLSDAEAASVAAHVRTLGRVPLPALSGNAERGRVTYNGKGGCARCHAIAGQGGAFGPDLTGVGAIRGPSHLRESLLDPAAQRPRDFAMVRVVAADGAAVSGVRVNEDTFSVQIRDVSGKLHSFWKSGLREFRVDLAGSPMPSYRQALTAAEVEDLVAYLAGLREPQ